MLRDLCETFSDSRLLDLGEDRWHDLRALVHAYRGTLLAPCKGVAPYYNGPHSNLFSIANEHLKKGSGDPEVFAIVHLHQGGMPISLIDLERSILEKSEKHIASFLEVRSSAGHVADMHYLAGHAELQLSHERRGHAQKAQESFSLACDAYPRACICFRFFSAFEAARVSYHLSEPEAAHRYLAIARAAFEEHPLDAHAGSLSWLSGCLEQLADRPAEAEAMFRESISQYHKKGKLSAVAYVLRELKHLYRQNGRESEAAGLQEELCTLVRTCPAGLHHDDNIDAVLKHAQKLGIDETGRKELRKSLTEEEA